MMNRFARKLICLMCCALGLATGIPAHARNASLLSPVAQEALNSAAQQAVQLGLSAAKQGDYLAAINHFQEALRLAPNASEIFFYLGVAEARIPGRELRAICWLGAYLSARPKGPDAEAVRNQISKLKVAHQKTLSLVLKSVADAARFSELKGPSMRDVARRWASIGDLTAALQVAANLAELPDSQAEAYAAIAEVQAKSREISGAIKTTYLIADSQPAKGLAWRYIVRSQVAVDLAGAQKTIEGIQDPTTKDATKRILSEFQARIGNVSGALKTAESIQDADIQGSTRHEIVLMQVDAGDLDGALNTAKLIPAWVDQSAALYHVTLSQARKGNIDEALKTAALCPSHRLSDLQSRIAEIQAERGDFAGALRTTDLVEKDKQDYHARSMVQAAIAQAQMNGGDGPGARKSLASSRQSAVLLPDSDRKSKVLRRIATLQAQNGDLAGALTVADQIQSVYWKAQTQGEMAIAQAKGGDVAGALTTADMIQDPHNDLKGLALAGIAEVQAKAGNVVGALRTADLIQSSDRKGYAQGVVAKLQVQRGDLAGAQRTIALIQDIANQRTAQEILYRGRLKAGDSITLWLHLLNDSDVSHDCPLATAPFVDLPNHLQSLSASEDPKKVFGTLYRSFMDMIDAEIVVNQLLEQQAVNNP